MLQRCANHDTFSVRRVDLSRHAAYAERFHVDEVPVLMVVEGRRVVARLDKPNGIRPIAALLEPWLKRHAEE